MSIVTDHTIYTVTKIPCCPESKDSCDRMINNLLPYRFKINETAQKD